MIHVGDCIEVMASMDPDSIDSIVTDPPYDLGFMGKSWDTVGEDFHVQWAEQAFRVLKPGGHIVSFGGTRTYHRMACAIEDAGFEVRDMLAWMYGSGFPKSLDISKAIDKAAGAEREVVGYSRGVEVSSEDNRHGGINRGATGIKQTGCDVPVTAPATAAAREWDGWGTALKPAHEVITLCRKPYTLSHVIDILVPKIGGFICQLQLCAKGAGKSSLLSPNGCATVDAPDSALWSAVEGCNTLGDLYGLMGTLQSESAIPTSLSIALSWLNILAALSDPARTYITEMESGLITDLITLNSLPWPHILDCTTEGDKLIDGDVLSASPAGIIFTAVWLKSNAIHTPSAQESAISKAGETSLHPERESIVLARKPLSEPTVAANVLKWGTGGINVDGCRVSGGMDDTPKTWAQKGAGGKDSAHVGQKNQAMRDAYARGDIPLPTGRWPANVVLDEEAGQILDQQSGEAIPKPGRVGVKGGNRGALGEFAGSTPNAEGYWPPDVGGGASRFFYCAKASSGERNAWGQLSIEARKRDESRKDGRPGGDNPRNRGVHQRQNHHPTVKPVNLMRWLVRLLTPPGGTVLDPFLGSGTTAVACEVEGFDWIGIEKEPEYAEIAKQRVAAGWSEDGSHVKNASPGQGDLFKGDEE